jgi:hypothetical protein
MWYRYHMIQSIISFFRRPKYPTWDECLAQASRELEGRTCSDFVRECYEQRSSEYNV